MHSPVLIAVHGGQRWDAILNGWYFGVLIARPLKNARRGSVATVSSTRKVVRETIGVHVTTSILLSSLFFSLFIDPLRMAAACVICADFLHMRARGDFKVHHIQYKWIYPIVLTSCPV